MLHTQKTPPIKVKHHTQLGSLQVGDGEGSTLSKSLPLPISILLSTSCLPHPPSIPEHIWKVTSNSNNYSYCICYIPNTELNALEMLFQSIFSMVHETNIITLILKRCGELESNLPMLTQAACPLNSKDRIFVFSFTKAACMVCHFAAFLYLT